jgi:beta-1,4-mannosyltransferase
VGTAPIRVVFLPAWPDNPYQELLAGALAARGATVRIEPRRRFFLPRVLHGGRADVVHFHSPDHFAVYHRSGLAAALALAAFAAQLGLLRMLGCRIVWTAHDAINHEGLHPRVDALCRRLTGAAAAAVIVHCEVARRLVADRFPPRGILRVIPHGPYGDDADGTPSREDRAAARAALALPLDRTLLLVVGNLRRHKAIPELLAALRGLERERASLVIAGRPFDDAIAGEIAAAVDGRDDVVYRPGFLAEADLGRHLRAADVVVCPFSSSLTSGSVALAASFARACVAPRLGCVAEMLGGGSDFLYDPGEPDGLRDAIRRAIDRGSDRDLVGVRARQAIRAHGWGSIAAATAEVYRSCLGRRAGSSC